ncbi:hypothetical protein JCM21900_006068 [Sporobolomyces salmonicolor]
MFRPSARIYSALRRGRPAQIPRSDDLPRRIGPQLAFTGGVATLAIGSAAYATNKDTEERNKGYLLAWRRNHGTGLQRDLARSRWEDVYKRARGWVGSFPGNRLVVILSESWLEMSEAKRTQAGLIALFGGVWLAWRLPQASRFGQYLAHDPLSGRSATLLTSIFSHRTLPHLAFNSIALYSFGTACFAFLDYSEHLARSTSRYEFLAFFATAGLASSFVSHVWFSRIVAGRLLQIASTPQVRQAIVPSLGASGAVYACLTMTALSFPESNVSLIFLPFIPLPIGAATAGLVVVDLIGLLRGWRMFDHAAHLSGAAMGALWWAYGHDWFERLRVALLQRKH